MTLVTFGLLIPVAMSVGFISVILCWVIRQSARRRKVIQAVAAATGGRSAGDTFEGAIDGIAYRGEYEPPTEGWGAILRLIVPHAATGRFRVIKRGILTSLARWVVPWRVVRTHDPTFDNAVTVISRQASFARRYFADAATRETIRQLFALRCTQVFLSEDGFEAEWTPFELQQLTPDLIRQTVQLLGALARALGTEAHRGWPGTPEAVHR